MDGEKKIYIELEGLGDLDVVGRHVQGNDDTANTSAVGLFFVEGHRAAEILDLGLDEVNRV